MPDFNPTRLSDEEREKQNAFYAEEKAKIVEAEKEKHFLLDKSIGGENALRPPDEFIEEKLGAVKSRKEIEQEASSKADERFEQWKTERAEAEREYLKQDFTKSEEPTRSFADRLREKAPNADLEDAQRKASEHNQEHSRDVGRSRDMD